MIMNTKLPTIGFYPLAVVLVILFGILVTSALGDAVKESSPLEDMQGRQGSILRLVTREFNNEVFEQLLVALKDVDPTVRFASTWVLKPFRPDWIQHLTTGGKAIGSKSPFSDTQIDELEKSLLAGLEDEDPWINVEALVRMSELQNLKQLRHLSFNKAVKFALIEEAKSPDPYIRAAAVEGLTWWNKDLEVKTTLDDAWNDENWRVRYAAFLADAITIETLSRAINDENVHGRTRAIVLLKNRFTHDPRTVPLLIGRLIDPSGLAVLEAIEALAELKSHDAVEPLVRLSIENPVWKKDVARAIFKITGKTLDELIAAGNIGFSENLLKATIRSMNVQEVTDKLDKGNLHDRVSSALQLTWSTSPKAVEALIKASHDKEDRVRFAAIDALGTYYLSPSRKIEPVISALIQAVKDQNSHVRRIAIIKLRTFAKLDEFKRRLSVFLNEVNLRESDLLVKMESHPAADSLRDGLILDKILN